MVSQSELTYRNRQVVFSLKVVLTSERTELLVFLTSLKKNNIAYPPQPLDRNRAKIQHDFS